MKLRLFTVPYDSGQRAVRMGAGPDRLLEAGLPSSLEAAGHRVEVEGIEASEDGVTGEMQRAFELLRKLAGRVRSAREEGFFPIVLAGTCYSAVGTLAGLGDGRTGVLWFDTHADFNTPETTVSGFLDGMALAMLTGRCWTQLTGAVPGFRPVPEDRVVTLGTRDVDPLEAPPLDGSDVTVLAPAQVRSSLEEALNELRGRVDGAYVHIDLDVLDPSEGRANHLALPDGLTLAEMKAALSVIAGSFPVRAVALTAYDPSLDDDGRVRRAAFDLLDTILGSGAGG